MNKLLLTLAAAALAAGSVLAEDKDKIDPAKADVKVTITGNDTMQYDKNEFTVTVGQTVALTLKNVGQLPVEAMGHNLVILKPGTDMAKFAMAGMSGLSETPKRYVPKEKEWTDKIIVQTKVLGPGQEETIAFTAPEAGTYDYLCTFPGHFAIMKGKMIVKQK
jgi:azurin